MIRDIYTVWLRELRKLLKQKVRIIFPLIFPTILLIIFGFGFGNAFNVPGLDFSYVLFMGPGILGMLILFNSFGSGVSILEDKEKGFLRELLVAPINRLSIIMGKLFGGITTNLVYGLAMLIVLMFIGIRISNIIDFFGIIFVIVLLSAIFLSLGIILAVLIKEIESFRMVMGFIFMPLVIISGIFFPIKNLPVWLKVPSYVSPLTYGNDALRYFLLKSSELSLSLDLVFLIIICIVFVIFSAILFKRL